jgi:predicted PurR-regulated permease PerM
MTEDSSTERPYDFDRVVRLLIGAIIVIALIWLLRFLADVLIPFAIAVLLAYLINPIVTALEKRIRSRPAATLITVFGLLAVLVTLVIVLVPLMTNELRGFGSLIEQFKADTQSLPGKQAIKERFHAYVDAQESELYKHVLLKVKDTIVGIDVASLGAQAARWVAPGLWSLVSGVLTFLLGLTGLIIVLLYLIFVLIDFAKLEAGWRELLPPKYRDRIVAFVEEFSLAMSRYFRGQFIIAASVGLMFALGFWLIGLRMGIVLGIIIGLVNMVPYLQTICIPPALVLGLIRAIENGSSVFGSLALVLIVFGVVQLIQDAILCPWIMGKQTGLRPVALLLSVFIWANCWASWA